MKARRRGWGPGISQTLVRCVRLATSFPMQHAAASPHGLLDGICVIRTSEPAERLTAANGVRSYKSLALVEQSFRCLKGIDLLVRPIHDRAAARVRAHIFLCALAF